MDTTLFDEALALALKLTPAERLRLIGQVAVSVERVVEPLQETPAQAEHWGQALNRLLDSLEMTDDWVNADIDDPVEWVRQLREDERKQRLGDWGEAE